MNFEEARKATLDLFRRQGKAKNSQMLDLLGGDKELLDKVREDLIFDDLARDKDGVGLVYVGPAEPAEPSAAGSPPEPESASPQLEAAAPSKPTGPLRIFLSYGRQPPAHVAVARRLKADLEARGHEVWMDEERLKPGGDWEQAIDEGIEWVASSPATGRVVLLMTPHAVRRPDGYCLNEIARAVSRSLTVVPVMLVWCEPPLSICRVQWLDMQDCLPLEDRAQRYKAHRGQLIEALEQNRLDFEGAQASLRCVLDPLEFDADIARHLDRFTGRQWVFDQIDQWLAEADVSRVFWITGDPGVGKTALAAWLATHRGEVAAIHFCRHGHRQKADPRHCVASLAYQLSTQLPDYADRLRSINELEQVVRGSDARTLFDRLIVQPLSSNFPRPQCPVVVLIDALDEATHDGRNELAQFLASEFSSTPDWLRLVITSRPDPEVKHPLQRHTPRVLNALSPDNLDDIRAFLRRELKPYAEGGEVPAAAVETILARSEGIFLYADWVRQEVAERRLSLDEPQKFPQGLGGVYAEFFARQFPDLGRYEEQVVPALEVLTAALDPLQMQALSRMFGWTERQASRFRRGLGSLFTVAADGRIRAFHRSLGEWLGDEERAGPYFVGPADGHRRLASMGWDEYQSGPQQMSAYAVTHLPEHLIAVERRDDLESLLTDIFYLEAKARDGRVFDLAGDFSAAIEGLPEDRPQRRILKLLDEALRRDIHFIAQHAEDYPQGLFQCLWNNGWWYDCDEAAAHYETGLPSPASVRGAGGEGGHAPGEAPDAPRLFRLLEHWRTSKEQASPGFPWLRCHRPPAMHLGTAQKAVLRGHDGHVESVSYSPDGRRIASGSDDKTVRVWDAESGAELAVLRGHELSVSSVTYSRDGRRIASGSWDQTVRVWDAESGAELVVLRGHESAVTSVSYSPDGRRIASGSWDNTVRVWDAESGAELAILHGHEDSVLSVSYSPDGWRIASGSKDRTLRVWDAESGAELAVLRGHEDWVLTVTYSPDGRRIASGSWDKTIRVWGAESGAGLAVLHGHGKNVASVSYTPDGRRIVSGAGDKTVRVWGAESGAELAVLHGHEDSVLSVSYSPDGWRIASGSKDRTLRVWDAESGAQLAVLRGHEGWISSVSYSPDGRRIASGSGDKTVRVWDAESGVELAVLHGHEDSVLSVSYSPDGRRIASGSKDRTLRVWDAESGAQLAVLRGHEGWISSVSYIPDGRRIVSVSADHTLRVWDVQGGRCLEVLHGSADATAIAAGPAEFPWRAMIRNQEIVIEPAGGGNPVAKFPIPLDRITTHLNGRTWAGASGNHLYIITLEGVSQLARLSDGNETNPTS